MKTPAFDANHLSRRQFVQTTATLAGAALLSRMGMNDILAAEGAAKTATVKRTATDQVTLGKTGIKCSRLGFGTGSNNGFEQTALGREGFNDLIRYAYDQGITYIDTAATYQTFDWIAGAIKGLPREKLFIQSKIQDEPENIPNVLERIDLHRKTFNTDYVDSMLIHCMTAGNWTDEWKRIMDGYNEAKSRKWIRAKGVSCHSFPALQAATRSEFNEVHLVRVNPQGKFMDGARAEWGERIVNDVNAVLGEIKTMKEKGRGVIGMKIIGNGSFRNAEDREKSIRFAMGCKDIDAIVIGFTKKEQIAEAIERMNRALAEA
jgi:predicted aldo/keto reductase-like oxidoreductase